MHPIERLRHVARASGVPQAILLRETASAMMSFADDPASLLTACRRMISRQPESGAQVTLAARMVTAPDPRASAWQMIEEIEDDRTARGLVDALPDDATICVIGWPDAAGPHLSRRGDLRVLMVHVDGSGWGRAERLVDQDVDAIDLDPPALGAAARAAAVTIVEAVAVGSDEALVPTGSLAAASVAKATGGEVWLAAPAGTVLPNKMWEGLVNRYELKADEWEQDYERLPLALVTRAFAGSDVLPADSGDASDASDAPALGAALGAKSTCPIAPELFR